MKRKTLVAAATAAAIAFAGLVGAATATTSTAATKYGSIHYPDVVFYKGQHNKNVKTTFKVNYDGGWDMLAEVSDPKGNYYDGEWESGSKAGTKSYINRIYADEGYGKHTVRAEFRDHDYNLKGTSRDTFYIKRATYLKVNASPEPVKKGKYVTVKGTAKYWAPDANYGSGKIKALSGKTVKVYFDPAGKKKAVYKGADKVDRKGVFSRNFRQSTKGTWIVKYAGTATLTADTAKDAVRVKK